MHSQRYSKAALHTTLLLCAASVVVCALTAFFMSTRRAAAEHRNELAEQRTQIARARLDRANENRALIDTYRDRYDRLVSEGLLVRFDRAVAGDWFDAAIRTRRVDVIDDYVIGKDAPYAGPETAELTAFHVIAHRLDFTATVTDEDEFADLMNSIEKRVPGTTAQEACSLAGHRQSTAATSSGTEPLAARCALVWYEFIRGNADLTASVPGS
jgi:hypothetical protein